MSPSNNETPTDSEVFRTGVNAMTAMLPPVLGAFAALTITGLVVFVFTEMLPSRHPRVQDIAGWFLFLAIAVGLAFWAVCLIRDRRNSFVRVSAEGILRQDWRRRQLVLPWSAVKRLVVHSLSQGGHSLAIHYLDGQGRTRKATLFMGDELYGDSIDSLKQAIMRYKAFPNRRKRWWVSSQEIYEE